MNIVRIGTPLGTLEARATDVGLRSLSFVKDRPDARRELPELQNWLKVYFSGKDPGRFDMPLDLSGSTPFRRRIYEELRMVPFGGYLSYKELGEMAGYPGSARAVGGAVGANPIVLVVPCHRVLARSGSKYTLGGFSAGLELKRRLLKLEDIAPLENFL